VDRVHAANDHYHCLQDDVGLKVQSLQYWRNGVTEAPFHTTYYQYIRQEEASLHQHNRQEPKSRKRMATPVLLAVTEQKSDHDFKTPLLLMMKLCKLRQESVDVLDDAARSRRLSTASQLLNRNSDIEDRS
jgi:hypothetical protein